MRILSSSISQMSLLSFHFILISILGFVCCTEERHVAHTENVHYQRWIDNAARSIDSIIDLSPPTQRNGWKQRWYSKYQTFTLTGNEVIRQIPLNNSYIDSFQQHHLFQTDVRNGCNRVEDEFFWGSSNIQFRIVRNFEGFKGIFLLRWRLGIVGVFPNLWFIRITVLQLISAIKEYKLRLHGNTYIIWI